MQILIVQSNHQLASHIDEKVTKLFPVECLSKFSVNEAIELMQIMPDISYIFIHEEVFFIEKLLDFIQSKKIILLGNSKKIQHQHILAISEGKNLELEITMLLKAEFNKLDTISFYQKNEMIAVELDIFSFFTKVPVDVFQEIISDLGESVFHPIIKKQIEYKQSLIASLRELNIHSSYINKQDFALFKQSVHDILKAYLLELCKVHSDFSRLAFIHRFIIRIVANFGFDDVMSDITHRCINDISRYMLNGESLKKEVYSILESHGETPYTHFLLTAKITSTVIKMSSPKCTTEQVYPFIFASLFSHIGLRSEYLFKIKTTKDPAWVKLNLQDKDAVLFHPLVAAQSIKNYTQIKKSIIDLVLGHHGISTGLILKTKQDINFTNAQLVLFISAELADLICSHKDFDQYLDDYISEVHEIVKDQKEAMTVCKIISEAFELE